MKYTMALLASASMAAALTQQCSGTAVNENGNYFCGAINHILYQGVGGSGSYQSVQGMGPGTDCPKETKNYNGPLAPFDEDLSLHFRGPLNLKEVAVYNLSNENKKKRDLVMAEKEKRTNRHTHGHQQLHEDKKKKRTEWVTATINGDVVSWEKVWYGPKTDSPAPAATAAPAPVPVANANAAASAVPKPKPAASGKDWDRVSYYNAETQQAENIVFLGNYGGQGSGVWDDKFGNSLAYLNATSNGGCASPQILKDMLIPSNNEFAIFSGEKCGPECGFSRAQDVAYKGFEGSHKVFLFHFKMPMDGSRAFNGDMPAIWALNGEIPRVAQYSDCSCWPPCGEIDFFEVLAKGDDKCKSTIHLTNGGGSSDYFPRPTDNYMKGAVIFDADASAVAIKILPYETDFSAGLDDATVQAWMTGDGPSTIKENGVVQNLVSSLFQLAGGSLN